MPNTAPLPWRRLLGEFVVIVFGVLAALGVDAWRDGLTEAALARDHLRNLVSDLSVDSVMIETMDTELEVKRASLEVLQRVAAGTTTTVSSDSVARLLLPSAVYGWRIPEAQNAAYEELTSTGGLRLISDPILRSQIVLYYEDWEHQVERLDRHRSSYPNAVYRLLPPGVIRGLQPLTLDSTALLAAIATSEMRGHLNHEENYLNLLTRIHEVFDERLFALLVQVRIQIQ